MILESATQILYWLKEFDGFANAKLSYQINRLTKHLFFQIEYLHRTSLAGERQLVKVISAEASGVEIIEGDPLDSEINVPIYKIYALKEKSGLNFDTWTENRFSITCRVIAITKVQEIERITKPALSKDALTFKIRMNEKPSAEYWINHLHKKGYDATYFGYFGDEMPIEEIRDYTGASIRPKHTKDSMDLGIKFCKVAFADGEFELTIELQNSALNSFWKGLVEVISEMEIMQVKSGNVVFNKSEWLNFLETETLPKRLL